MSLCRERINKYLQEKNIQFRSINSIRGDKVEHIFKDIEGLMQAIFEDVPQQLLPEDQQAQVNNVRNSCQTLEAWKALLPWLTSYLNLLENIFLKLYPQSRL